jgi:DNA-repair protein complementing XP-A cells
MFSERALHIWESWEKIDAEKEDRLVKNTLRKQKNFDKKLKKLKQDVRASTYKIKILDVHEHNFTKIEDLGNDNFRKSCDCGFEVEYEEM